MQNVKVDRNKMQNVKVVDRNKQAKIDLENGNGYMNGDQYDLAKELYEKVIQKHVEFGELKHKDYMKAVCLHGVCSFRSNKYADALNKFASLPDNNEKALTTYVMQGICHLKLGQNREAFNTFDKSIRIYYNSDDATRYLGKACALYRLSRYEEADFCLNKAKDLYDCKKINESFPILLLEMARAMNLSTKCEELLSEGDNNYLQILGELETECSKLIGDNIATHDECDTT